jgi:DNA-binding GntR family transcriptional regulator
MRFASAVRCHFTEGLRLMARLKKPTGPTTARNVPHRRTLSSSEQIFRHIVEGLYLGRYVSGQRLIEADLTREFETSRGTIREALRFLSAEGIVTLNLHRGAEIRRLTRAEARDMMALLEVLIGFAARSAAEHIDHANNAALLKTSLKEVASYEGKPDSFELVRARNRFYRTLIDIGGNSALRQILVRYHVHLLRVQFRPYHLETEAERFSDYRKIAEAVLAGSGRDAETAARRHVRQISSALENLPSDAFATAAK